MEIFIVEHCFTAVWSTVFKTQSRFVLTSLFYLQIISRWSLFRRTRVVASELCLIARPRPSIQSCVVCRSSVKFKPPSERQREKSGKVWIVRVKLLSSWKLVRCGSPAWSVRTVVVRLCGQCLFVGADSVCSSVLAVFVRRCGQTVSVRLCGQRVSVGTDRECPWVRSKACPYKSCRTRVLY